MDDRAPGARIENSAATAPRPDDPPPLAPLALGGGAAAGGGPGQSVLAHPDAASNQPGAPTTSTARPSGTGSSAAPGAPPTESISYSAARVIGNGSFGVVFQATVRETGETVAIKKVLQDKRYKNRELQIMRMLDHTNIVKLKHCFYSSGEKQDEVYLNLVLEYIPETVYRISRHYSKVTASIPAIFIKLYVYQLLRALAYIHASNVTHRDIKPQNLLLDPATQVLKLCDFGSAKILVPNEPNISYICSRYYRAPELIFGATDYLPAIDIWSTGCVMAELMLGQPLFPGESGVDQLVEIIKVLGTPSREEIMAMNQNYTEFKFPSIRPHPWHKVFRARTTPDAIDLVSKMLQYSPTKRLKPMEGLTHAYFDELRCPTTRLPNGRPLPPLFDFSEREFQVAGPLARDILPPGIYEELCAKYGRPAANSAASASAGASAGAGASVNPGGGARSEAGAVGSVPGNSGALQDGTDQRTDDRNATGGDGDGSAKLSGADDVTGNNSVAMETSTGSSVPRHDGHVPGAGPD